MQVFQRLKGPRSKVPPDRITYSILIDRLAKDGKFADARDMMDEMKSISSPLLSPLLPLHASPSCFLPLLFLSHDFNFDLPQDSGLKADAFLYTNVILALGKAGKIDSVTDAYDEMLGMREGRGERGEKRGAKVEREARERGKKRERGERERREDSIKRSHFLICLM